MKKLALIALLALIGCSSNPKYVDGNMLQVGLYIPTGESLVGLQVMNWLSGVSVHASSNQPFKVVRNYSSTNDYLGVIHIREHVQTTVETK